MFEDDTRVYFVAETKFSTKEKDLRRDERLKIECGKRHFEACKDAGLSFKAVQDLAALLKDAVSDTVREI